MPRRPPERTAYNRAVARLGPSRRWASLSREEKIELTTERLRRFYDQAMAEEATPYHRAQAAKFFAATLDRLVDLTPKPVPSMSAVDATPEARAALARRILAPDPPARPRHRGERRPGTAPATRW